MIKRRGSSQISDFGGLQRVTPILAWSFFLAGMSALALPGLSSFISEFLVLVGAFAKYPVAAILGTTGIILAALYVLIAVQKSLHGETPATSVGIPDLNLREKIAIAPVIAVLVVLGFYPKPVLNVINTTTQTVMTHAGVVDPVAKVAK